MKNSPDEYQKNLDLAPPIAAIITALALGGQDLAPEIARDQLNDQKTPLVEVPSPDLFAAEIKRLNERITQTAHDNHNPQKPPSISETTINGEENSACDPE